MRFFQKDSWKGVAFAIIAVVIGQVVLAWQYYRLEEKRLPLIEQQLAEQREELDRQGARKAVVSFLDAWQQGNKELAMRFLTENTVLQEEQGIFSLEKQFANYQIVKLERTGHGEFRAQVEKQQAEGLPGQTEILRVVKILDSYYIDSLEIAG
tara:strand:+ start:198 stop:656 length:459 start_codon:yes stop_codon:yes gene_type:complete